MINKIHNMDCVEGLKMLPDNSVDLTVTSPPYFNAKADQIAKEMLEGGNEASDRE